MIKTLKKRCIALFKELKKEGISKSSVSEKTGISRPTLDKLFNGDINNITLGVLEKLFKVYGYKVPEENFIENSKLTELSKTNTVLVGQLEVLVNQIKFLQEKVNQLEKTKS